MSSYIHHVHVHVHVCKTVPQTIPECFKAFYPDFKQCNVNIGAGFHLEDDEVVFEDFHHEVVVLKCVVGVQDGRIA